MAKFRTHYDNLKVTRNADAEVIKASYRALMQKWHPDKNPHDLENAERITNIIKTSYEILSDPLQRQEHDLWITQMEKEELSNTHQNNNNHYNMSSQNSQTSTSKKRPKKWLAGLLGIIFGSIGAHRFYLGQWWGLIYVIAFLVKWPLLSIIGFIEGVLFFILSEEQFQKRCRNLLCISFKK